MRLLHTVHVPPGEGPFPTLFLLHGWGASAHDLFGLAPLIEEGQALVICPQGPVEVPVGPGMTGYGWFPLVPGQPPDPDAFREGAGHLRDFVNRAREAYPVDPERVAVGGFSQGGVMGFDLVLRQPERYAGLAALSTWLPAPLAEDLSASPYHEELPVLVIHGTQDQMVDVERARESRERLRPLGVRIQYRELPMGHEIRPEALKVLVEWVGQRFRQDD